MIQPKQLHSKVRNRYYSPVPVQFDWDKIRTEMKPIKMARTKA